MVVDKKYKLKDIQEYLPLVCTEEPAPNSAFCEVHSQIVQKFGHPIKVRDFIRSCEVDPTHYNREGRKKVQKVLRNMLEASSDNIDTETGDIAQGISHLLRNTELTNDDNMKSTEDGEDQCNKNTGVLHRLHNWFVFIATIQRNYNNNTTLISTEGALRLPMTYDQSHLTHPTHPIHLHIAVKTTSPLNI